MNEQIKIRFYEKPSNEYYFNMDELFKNVSVIPSKILCGEDKLIKAELFSGITDDNGKMIYQGDIVERIYRYEIRFKNGVFFGYNPKGNMTAKELLSGFKIIGNINQNADLLQFG
jgi:hypothetical protein